MSKITLQCRRCIGDELIRRILRTAVGLCALILAPSCSPQQRSALVAPTAVTGSSSNIVGVSGPQRVDFPPRNEPFAFRQDLETKYRDVLHRGATSSYVDIEGTIVWTQEYLRYRVNRCSHADAVARVFRQIDGLGVPPVCGTTSSATFPPRNEPFDFRNQLEAKYRDGLKRSPTPTFVDVEGDIVWTQEYLRYRVSSCGHADAELKVFVQIDGRGVQADCTPPPPSPPAPTPPSPPPTAPARRTDTFAFTLPAGSQAAVVVGPVLAGNGTLDVTLSFSGNFVILACVGTTSACFPFGGTPSTASFNIPGNFRAGPIQASVYFNPNVSQPPGNASGTVTFTYTPQ